MTENSKQTIKKILIFLACLAIPLAVGFVSYIIIKDHLDLYQNINLPFFAPPSVTFSIIWPILYGLMGISTYLIVMKQQKVETASICVYAVQLFFNFVWPILFFATELFLFSSVWLLVLLFFIIWMIVNFFAVSKTAGYLQIPYLLWTIFACVLNFTVFFMNM